MSCGNLCLAGTIENIGDAGGLLQICKLSPASYPAGKRRSKRLPSARRALHKNCRVRTRLTQTVINSQVSPR
eukprot:1569762-Pleurochrysis_carterae.AAC.2